jgi:hypothetical protein
MRWSEEVLLLQEEMRRVSRFLHWRAEWWEARAHLWPDLGPAEREGMAAYSWRQAALFRGMRADFECRWKGIDVIVAGSTRHPDVLASLEGLTLGGGPLV